MNLKEVSALLGWRREEVRTAIEEGVELPKSKKRTSLLANPIGNDYDIGDGDLDTFIAAFEREEPGRHPPVSVRRALLVEANHKCAICEESAPLFQFHHIVEFSKLKHHDPNHMLAVCGSCHDKINIGLIDHGMQRMYKERLKDRTRFLDDFPVRFSWDDLREIITALHEDLAITDPSAESKYDFSDVDIEQKNELNRLGEDYFAMMKDHHEPYFGRIDGFLRNPINSELADLYHEIVDELRSKVAVDQNKFDSFESILMTIRDAAKGSPDLKPRCSTLNILLSFMYFQCDIGRKA